MPSEPIWLPQEVVVSINLDHVTATGENHSLIFPENLAGAIERPFMAWTYGNDADVVSLGVRYMEAIARAHAFEQGNKRTAFDAGFVFMAANGYDLTAEADQELVAVAFIEIIEKTRTTASFVTLIKEYVQLL